SCAQVASPVKATVECARTGAAVPPQARTSTASRAEATCLVHRLVEVAGRSRPWGGRRDRSVTPAVSGGSGNSRSNRAPLGPIARRLPLDVLPVARAAAPFWAGG